MGRIVERDPASRKFRLGPGLMSIAADRSWSIDVRGVSQPMHANPLSTRYGTAQGACIRRTDGGKASARLAALPARPEDSGIRERMPLTSPHA